VVSTQAPLVRLVRWIGAQAIGFVRAVVEVVSLLYGALVVVPIFMGARGAAVTFELCAKQVRFTGLQGLPLVSLAALALGTLIISEANARLPAEYAVTTAAHILVGDVMPLVVAMIVIGRSGTAVCVELAGMKLSGQLDALLAMGMPLEHVIVLPRLIGGVVATACLTVYGVAVGAGLGYAVSKALAPLPFTLQAILDEITVGDLGLAIGKALLFGVSIVLVAVREGYSVQASAREVPQATTRAVVRAMGLCLVLNSAISVLA
jgi:phospholipid/cholesterol/gamma-HCH transport system permease protein